MKTQIFDGGFVAQQSHNLEGRLEIVKISYCGNSNCGVGSLICPGNRLDGKTVDVANAGRFLGQKCLARFDAYSSTKFKLPRGNFVSTEIPFEFEGLFAEEFVLVALWNPQTMYPRNGNSYYPDLIDINKHYDPGKVARAVFIPKNFFTDHQIYCLFSDGFKERTIDYPQAFLDFLPKPEFNSRLIVVEPDSDIEKIKKIIRENELKPIKMQPFN